MPLPVVTIVGRPNVGKSSLLNSLSGQMISIVDPTAGVTRDRVSAVIEYQDFYFELVDTGGYGIVDADALEKHVEFQLFQAISRANLVLFVVDIREGIMPLDQQIAELLRKQQLDVVLVANKADSPKQFAEAGQFERLGFGAPICVSATNLVNRGELLDRIKSRLSHLPSAPPPPAAMKLAVVGKRNAGKSSLINAILGQERVIASPVPGTTRDAVDVPFEKDGKSYILIDTAGVRKIGKMANDIEFYGYTRVLRSIRRADVVLFLIDAAVPVSQVDKRLAQIIAEEYKPCVIVINKWDLAKGKASSEDYADYLDKTLTGLRRCPIVFTTATQAKNIQSVIDIAAAVFKQAQTQIPTPTLNKAVHAIAEQMVASGRRAGLPKVYYAVQVASQPITLMLFVNRPSLFDAAYQRFFVHRLGEMLGLEEAPIRLILRPRGTKDKTSKGD